VYADTQLHRIAWCEIYRDLATNEIVAVPSLVSHDALEYLHVESDHDSVIIKVVKRTRQ
jgi:hypothetical protein